MDSAIPVGAAYWMPSLEELAEEDGLGYFHDTWMLQAQTASEVGSMLASEQEVLAGLDAVAQDAQTFERLAHLLDAHHPDFDFEPEEEDELAPLAAHADVGMLDTGRLDLGVGGLSYALALIGCVPAASCRGHHGATTAWSDEPVVFAAVDRPHAEWLQPLVQRSNCGFALSPERPEFLIIHANSITDMTDLADAILTEAEHNPPPPLRPGLSEDDDTVHEAPPPVMEGQEALFD